MRKLHDAIETRAVSRLRVQVELDDGILFSITYPVDQVYVNEDGKHVIIHSVLPSGARRVETFTNVESLLIEGAQA